MAIKPPVTIYHKSTRASMFEGFVRQGIQAIQVENKTYSVTFDKVGNAIGGDTEYSSMYPRAPQLQINTDNHKSPSVKEVIQFMNCKDMHRAYIDVQSRRLDAERCDTDKYDALCLSGGGVRGLAFSGIFKQLGKVRLSRDIKEVSGSSIGSLAALTVVLDMDPDEISDFVYHSIPKPNGKSIYKTVYGALEYKLKEHQKDIYHFLRGKGYPLLNAEGEVISDPGTVTALHQMTFKQLDLLKTGVEKGELYLTSDLRLKRLIVVATNKRIGKEVELSLRNSPDLPIADAIRASCGYPVKIGSKKISTQFIKDSDIEVRAAGKAPYITLGDGGITNNTPYLYLEEKHKLVIAFKTAQERTERDKLLLSEKIVQSFLKTPVYEFENFDISMAEAEPSVALFFLDSDVGATQIEKAVDNFHLIELDARRQFERFERGRRVIRDVTNEGNEQHDKLPLIRSFPIDGASAVSESESLLDSSQLKRHSNNTLRFSSLNTQELSDLTTSDDDEGNASDSECNLQSSPGTVDLSFDATKGSMSDLSGKDFLSEQASSSSTSRSSVGDNWILRVAGEDRRPLTKSRTYDGIAEKYENAAIRRTKRPSSATGEIKKSHSFFSMFRFKK
ncbi:patatin-like phospholipase family protein [Shewanella sp. 202IG2-18]|uniref:patatin-like phospholipase family protein n=1 Tax=Parashewanella hymeniacidonis TaxID=2807618 RepID=UPI001961DC53|nr:patatin-like phospholipase family protein [Parashewanella hymeniacidonis]MBM7073294.1 patatin-like phospholipase family protein [Parashewanella hymeniacidonis]